MATTAQRRQRKQAEYLRSLARNDPRRFDHEWNKRVVSWLYEIGRRGALLCSGEDVDRGADRIFEVVEQAERLITACGVENLVGSETLRVLTDECCKIVARVYEPAMYTAVTQRWYGYMKALDRHHANRVANLTL
jgi:hypothetical protein